MNEEFSVEELDDIRKAVENEIYRNGQGLPKKYRDSPFNKDWFERMRRLLKKLDKMTL